MCTSSEALVFSHCPPLNTSADIFRKKPTEGHGGSADLRKFVEEHPVQAVFSGHIHQSCILSGTFEDRIGEARVYSVGNTGIDGPVYFRKCFALLYDSETRECKRLEKDVEAHSDYLSRVFE